MNGITSSFNEIVTSTIIINCGDDSNKTYFIPNQVNNSI